MFQNIFSFSFYDYGYCTLLRIYTFFGPFEKTNILELKICGFEIY